MTDRPILRVEQDVGLLTNVRMAVEIAVGLAHLTDRRLSFPDTRIPGAPVSSIPPRRQGCPASVVDLFELPVELASSDEVEDETHTSHKVLDVGTIGAAVILVDDDPDPATLRDFAHGRTRIERPPMFDHRVVDLRGRLVGFYSYMFYATRYRRTVLWSLLQGVRPRHAYRALGARIARELPGRFNAVHLRRSDITRGIPAYARVTPTTIADNLAESLATDVPLLVCSEVEETDPLFHELRQRFPNIVFATSLILDEYGTDFFDLPRHEDNALGLVTQEIASRSTTFVGTVGSTFTGMIQRGQLLRDPTTQFRYTADYTPAGPLFENGQYIDRFDGAFSWNRIGYAYPPETLSWFREWPEAG